MSFESPLSATRPRRWQTFFGDRWWLAAFLFLLIRTIAAIVEYPAMHADPDAYQALAEGWSASGTFGRATQDGAVRATAYRPPLYPWVLSWFVGKHGLWLPGVAVLHVLLGCLTSLLTWDIARRLLWARSTLTRVIPWLAGLMVALDPILLRQSSLLMTETSAAFIAVLIWWTWLRSTRDSDSIRRLSAVCIGILMGLSCLLRPSSLVWCPILILAILIHRWRSRRLTSNVCLCTFNEFVVLATMILVLAPWAIRNRAVLGTAVWTTTHGGYTLLLANNPILFQHFEFDGGSRTWDEDRFHHLWSKRSQGDPRAAEYWDAPDVVGEAHIVADEVIDDSLANQAAWATIARSPMLFAKASLIRIAWLWACWPAAGQASLLLRIAIGGWYGGVVALFVYSSVRGVAMWFSQRLSASTVYGWLPAVSLVIGLTAVHSIYWSNMRMRAPLIPIVAVVSTMALSPRRANCE